MISFLNHFKQVRKFLLFVVIVIARSLFVLESRRLVLLPKLVEFLHLVEVTFTCDSWRGLMMSSISGVRLIITVIRWK